MTPETSENRRQKILTALANGTAPISASSLAKHFQVSRQVIVGDIALLRASGCNIFATPKGYIFQSETESNTSFDFIGMVAVRHYDDELLAELYTVVDFGGCVIDVTIEHSVYGQLSGALNIMCRADADDFFQKLKENQVKPLSDLTSGIHLHRIGCKSEEIFERIHFELKKSGIALE